MWIFEIFVIFYILYFIFYILYLRYWISKAARWKVMWIFEKVNAVGVLGQIPLLGEITSRISNYARDIPCFTKIDVLILRDIWCFTKIYIVILRDIPCFTKNIYIVSLEDIGRYILSLGVEQELVERKGNLGETSNSVEVYFLPFQFLFNP